MGDYRFRLVIRYNNYSIYYDNKKMEYFRNNHINNMHGDTYPHYYLG